MAEVINRVEDLPDYATRPQLSELVGVAVQTLARWKVEGRGPKVTKIGHSARYKKSDVVEWLDSLSEAS